MKSFKQFLNEIYDKSVESQNAKTSALQNYLYSGWKIDVKNHAGSQAMLRRPDMKKEQWADFNKVNIEYVNANEVPDGEHIFYSRKKMQGVVVEVNHSLKRIKYITILDKGISRAAKPGTRKFMTEAESFYTTVFVD